MNFTKLKQIDNNQKSKLLNLINTNIDFLEKQCVWVILNYLKNSEIFDVPHSFIYEVLLINEINKILELNKITNQICHEGQFDTIALYKNTKFNFEFTIGQSLSVRRQKYNQLKKRKSILNNNFKNINILISPKLSLKFFDKSFNINFDHDLNLIKNSKYNDFVYFIKKETQYNIFELFNIKIKEFKSKIISLLNKNMLSIAIFG